MTSPGKWHHLVPTDLAGNLKFRRDILIGAQESEALQAKILEICAKDIIFWINTFTWQYNPLVKEESQGPFILRPYQIKALLDRPETTNRKGLLWSYENDKAVVIEKSREMGASWLVLLLETWFCVFRKGFQVLNISRTAEAVDSKSKNSLFRKLSYLVKRMPNWMVGQVDRSKMFFGFQDTDSEISGEASTGSSGAGGRAGMVNVDEFPEIREAIKVRQNVANISNFVVYTGTHLGLGTEFFRLTKDPEIVKIQMHWTRHPEKNQGLYSYDTEHHKVRFWKYVEKTDQIIEVPNAFRYPSGFKFDMTGKPLGGPHPGIRSPWYDSMCVKIGSERGVAMELDMDPVGASAKFFSQTMIWDHRLKYVCSPDYEMDLEYDGEGNPKKFQQREGAFMRLWTKLVDGKPPQMRYGVGIDVSGGVGRTPSCISVIAENGHKVVDYCNALISPDDLATLAVAVCRMFADKEGNGARLCWERHGTPGARFGRRIQALGYGRFYMESMADPDKLGKKQENIPGWAPTKRKKTDLLTEYRDALSNEKVMNHCEEALAECLKFKYDKDSVPVHEEEDNPNDPSGAKFNHGDRVMADGLAWLMISNCVTTKPEQRLRNAAEPGTLAARLQDMMLYGSVQPGRELDGWAVGQEELVGW